MFCSRSSVDCSLDVSSWQKMNMVATSGDVNVLCRESIIDALYMLEPIQSGSCKSTYDKKVLPTPAAFVAR